MTEADWIVLREITGVQKWSELAHMLGISTRHLYRYRTGDDGHGNPVEIPKTVLLAIEGLICRTVHAKRQPMLEHPEEVLAHGLLRRLMY